LFVKAERLLVGAAEVQRQVVQVEAVERQFGAGAQGQAQAGLGFRLTGGQPTEYGGGVAEVLGIADLQRPQRHRVCGAVLAAGLGFAAQGGTQHGVTRQRETAGQGAFVGVGLQLHHGHRRGRRQVVRVSDFQQVVGEGRVLGVEFELYAGGEVSEALKQTFDIRVGAVHARQRQPTGDLRVFLGELGGALAHVMQFLVVQLQQARIHGRLRWSALTTRTWPDSRSRSVCSNRRNGTGCAHRSPSISKLRAL